MCQAPKQIFKIFQFVANNSVNYILIMGTISKRSKFYFWQIKCVFKINLRMWAFWVTDIAHGFLEFNVITPMCVIITSQCTTNGIHNWQNKLILSISHATERTEWSGLVKEWGTEGLAEGGWVDCNFIDLCCAYL